MTRADLLSITAVFLDRDGVLNQYLPQDYVKSPEELIVIPTVSRAIKQLNDAELLVIVISNQQGVGKGLMTMEDLLRVQRSLETKLVAEAGAKVDKFYYCTDLKSAHSYRRKPEPGMLIEAAEYFGLILAETVFIGDSPTDIKAGQAAGVGATILLLSGITTAASMSAIDPPPDLTFTDLPQAVDWILSKQEDQ